MQQVDFPALLKRVDQGYESWRRPSLLLFGTSGGCGPQPGWVACLAAERPGWAHRHQDARNRNNRTQVLH
jgi:hypothetical protein